MATQVWVATAAIYIENVRAYNINYVVPDSVVTRFNLEAQGLVERRNASDTGVPTNGVDPATQAELTAALATITPAAIGALSQAAGDTRYDALGTAASRIAALPVALTPKRNVVYAGDSITAGTGSSTGPRAYVNIAHFVAGTRYVSEKYLVKGVGGNTSAQLLARFDTDVIANSPGVVHVQIGTNDAGNSVSADTFAANVTAMYQKCRAAGAAMTIGLVPPRSSSNGTATTRRLNRAYNEWILTWAPTVGVPIADTTTPLVDQTTGYLKASCDSGDGVHPSDEGHWRIATAVAAALRRLFPSLPSLPVRSPDVNLCPNGAMDGAGPLPTSWYEQPGGTGTAPTYSIVTDTSSTLTEGRWAQMDFDATASGGARTLACSVGTLGTHYAVGDRMQVEARVQVEDVAGYQAAALAGTANVVLKIVNSSGTQVAVALQNTITSTTGPIAFRFSGPAAGTAVLVWLVVTLPTGARARVRLGEVAVRNLTAEAAALRP